MLILINPIPNTNLNCYNAFPMAPSKLYSTLWPKNYKLEVGADQQKMLHYWTKYIFLQVTNSFWLYLKENRQ